MNVCFDARVSIFSRSRRTQTSTVRSRCVARRPQMRCSSSSRLATRPRSCASAYRSRNSVGVSSAFSSSTKACTERGSMRSSSTTSSAPRSRLDAGHELLHRERLDEVVVGADLQSVHAVVLGAAGRHHQDRRADPFGARLFDQRPAVEPGQHQVEHEHVGALVAQPGEPDLACADAHRVEPRRGQVLRHAVGDRVVVFDDEDLGHAILSLVTDPDYEALRTAFTASVSHELRTPLARLQALLETAELPGADLQGLLRQAQDEVVEMTELVDDVLFLSELEQGREVVALGDTEAAPVLRAVVDELTERAELSGLGLQLRIEDETIHVPLRRRMLRLVVENLLENALRYAGEGATCTITLARQHGNVLLEVADDGTGVPDADVPRLFERFFRSD